MINNTIHQLKQDIVLRIQLLGAHLTFHTTWGLFSPKSIDEGSILLLKCLEEELRTNSIIQKAKVLDLGCGYGALGIPMATRAKTVHMIDKDFVAIDYAKKNAEINQLKNCKAYLSNGFSHVHEKNFDMIVSNLPAKIGKELLWIFLEEAKQHLNPEGKLYVVFISGLKEFMKRNLHEIFGNYEKLGQNKTYIVMKTIKQ